MIELERILAHAQKSSEPVVGRRTAGGGFPEPSPAPAIREQPVPRGDQVSPARDAAGHPNP